MKWLYRHMHKDEKGFTLVELMIVIIILAILTAIAVPSYMVLRNRARTAAAQSEMKNIATALEMYFADKETYPAVATWVGDLEDGYMDPVPTTDPWGENDYSYSSSDITTTYTLTCTGADPEIVITDGQLQESDS
jgi:general secretion pathway protein G